MFEVHLHFAQPLSVQLISDSATEKHLAELSKKLDTIMKTIADLQTAVAAEDTVIDSAVTLIKGLADQIAALKPDQADIDALATDVQAKADALSAAVAANTPAAPEPPPA